MLDFPVPMRKWIPVFIVFLLWGCSPESHRRSADRQVAEILRDRKERTLGYQPQTDAAADSSPLPEKRVFPTLPVTVMSPPAPPPIERATPIVPEGPLGPERVWPEDIPPPAMGTETTAGVTRDLDARMQMGPPAPWQMPRRLDLFGAIDFAIEHSRSYRSRMEDVYLAALGVTLERHLFSPRPFAGAGLQFTGGQRDADYASALTATASAGIRQQLPHGGEIVAETLVQFVDALNGNLEEGESAEIALSASVPLLRGAGLVNLEPLIQSERDLIYTIREFEAFRRDFAVNVAANYFRLLTQQQAVENRRRNYADRIALTERTLALYAAGRILFLEVQRSLQAQLTAENALTNQIANYMAAVDDFKLLIGAPVEDELEIVPTELDVNIPHYRDDEVLEIARRYRLDLQTARDRVEDARRQVAVSQNLLLPDLDLTARGEVGNTAGTPARYLNDDTVRYSAGLNLNLPVDRLAERNIYRRSLISLERAQRNLSALNDQVTAEVRDSLRQIRSAQVSLEIQQRGITLAERRVEFANESLRQGRADAREVLEAQTDLLEAQDDYTEAMADLRTQVLQFLRDSGTLRVDPLAGALGRAMDRSGDVNNPPSPSYR